MTLTSLEPTLASSRTFLLRVVQMQMGVMMKKRKRMEETETLPMFSHWSRRMSH